MPGGEAALPWRYATHIFYSMLTNALGILEAMRPHALAVSGAVRRWYRGRGGAW